MATYRANNMVAVPVWCLATLAMHAETTPNRPDLADAAQEAKRALTEDFETYLCTACDTRIRFRVRHTLDDCRKATFGKKAGGDAK